MRVITSFVLVVASLNFRRAFGVIGQVSLGIEFFGTF